MKIAYSTLLGEYVRADEVEHADTAPFQIVCPACRDPVFKVARQANGGLSTFFSHHHKPKEIVADCELRVGGISQAEQDHVNTASRGQTLKAFQRVLRDALALDTAAYPLGLEASHAEIAAHQTISTFLNGVETFLTRREVSGDFNKLADTYLKNIDSAGIELETAFSIGIQRRIALDLVKHLEAPSSGRSRMFLLRHVFMLEMQNALSLQRVDLSQHPTSVPFVDFYSKITRMDLAALSRWINPDEGMRRSSIVSLSFRTSLVGTLLRLPYREMLANHNAGRPLLHGIAEGGSTMLMGTRRREGRHLADPGPSR